MKKYRVKYKDSEKVFGEYASPEEASAKLMKLINDVNNYLDGDYLSPSDYVIEEVECKEVNEEITDFETARKVLGRKTNDNFTIVRTKYSESDIRLIDVSMLVNEINPKHIEALIALNRLFTIAEAWNKADGFVPDFLDLQQDKWYPWFEYNKGAAGFVCESATYTLTAIDGCVSSRLCFKTYERAEQFGKQFAELYNKVFL